MNASETRTAGMHVTRAAKSVAPSISDAMYRRSKLGYCIDGTQYSERQLLLGISTSRLYAVHHFLRLPQPHP
jgi:hypothetical protein